MMRAAILFFVFSAGLGCSLLTGAMKSNTPAGDRWAYGEKEVTQESGELESDSIEGYGDITQLEDERVTDSFIVLGGETPTSFSRKRERKILAAEVQKKQHRFEAIYFDFDRRKPRTEMLRKLHVQATWLKAHPDVAVQVAGHCDARGSREYNMVLGEKRATWIKNYFRKQGISGERVSIISYGKERPRCLKVSENCHAANRRVNITIQ